MRLPNGWKENDECIALFREVREKMKNLLNGSSTESGTPSIPDPRPVRPALHDDLDHDSPYRLGNFMYNSRVYIERGSDKGRNWYALGKYLVRMRVAEAYQNQNEKDDFMVVDLTRCRMLLHRLADEPANDYKLRRFRY